MSQLALARATVEFVGNDEPSADYADVAVIVRAQVLTLSRKGEVVRDPEPATSVARTSRTTWDVFTSSGVFHVTRAGGCGCGR